MMKTKIIFGLLIILLIAVSGCKEKSIMNEYYGCKEYDKIMPIFNFSEGNLNATDYIVDYSKALYINKKNILTVSEDKGVNICGRGIFNNETILCNIYPDIGFCNICFHYNGTVCINSWK